MRMPRSAAPALALALSAVAVAGCGSGTSAGGRSSDGGTSSTSATTTSAADRAAASRGRVAGAAAVTLDGAVQSCLYDAGFTPETPPAGAVAAFQHPEGVEVALPSSAGDQPAVAAALASHGTPARVSKGAGLVVSGRSGASDTALRCGAK